jgi:hypothetical protein
MSVAVPDPKFEFELVTNLSKKLNAPSYFGKNWNSLVDVLRDLSWIPEKTVTICHADVPSLEADDLCIYLDILQKRVREWESREAHVLAVIFPVVSRHAIVRVLSAEEI